MGATSVTGVGYGAADGMNKGSEHMTLGVGHLIGPRVVACGSATTSGGGVIAVHIPLLAGLATDYVVLVTATSSVHGYVSTALAFGTDASFTITAGNSVPVYWAIVKKGL
jgi:hypothetical protein